MDALTGDVDCTIDIGNDFDEATVEIGDTATNVLTLNEGESQVYTIYASAKKK